MQFSVGNNTFRSKQAAIDKTKKILNNTPFRTMLAGEDFNYIYTLVIELHSRKLFYGCSGIQVRQIHQKGRKQRCFFIITPDGRAVDFSYKRLFETPEQRFKHDVVDALRGAIQIDIDKFKSAVFIEELAPCAISGRMVRWDESHVDHYGEYEFEDILQEWAKLKGGLNKIKIIDKGLYAALPDKEIEPFRKFHNERAKLRLVDSKEHQKMGKKK